MSTKLLNSKVFQTLLAGDFPLPAASSVIASGSEEQDEYRTVVRAFCALGATAVSLLAEAVEHQEITRKTVSKMVKGVESLGLLFITEGDRFLEMPYRIRPSLFGEDVLLAVDDMLDGLDTSRLVEQTNLTTTLSP
jgi:hypothetical protein